MPEEVKVLRPQAVRLGETQGFSKQHVNCCFSKTRPLASTDGITDTA